MNCQLLLESYDQERRPIGERVAKTSLYNMRAHALILDEAIGLSPTKDEAENMKAMAQYFDLKNQDKGLAKREEVDKALDQLDVEFYAHGAEVGWFYDFEYNGTYGSRSKYDNPQVNAAGEMELCTYYPTDRPGSQLPHAWVHSRASGSRTSTRDLVLRDKLLLLATSSSWRRLEHPLVEVKIFDDAGGEVLDMNRLLKGAHHGNMEQSGALLVRPDAIVGFRFLNDKILGSCNVRDEFQAIVQTVLSVTQQ